MDPLADFQGLTDVALRRRTEVAHGLFVAEGAQTAARALGAGYAPRTLAVSEARWARDDVQGLALQVQAAGGTVHVDTEDRMSSVAGFDVHRGVLASFARRPLPALDEVAGGARTLAVLEAVVDHTNVGAVFRSAVALGADAVVLDPRCADPLYRRAIRTSMGAVFAVPYARGRQWPADLVRLRAAGFRLLALSPDEDAEDLAALAVEPGEKVGLLLGAEGPGLSGAALGCADARVALRMHHQVDSLNVAACAAVAFWAIGQARARWSP